MWVFGHRHTLCWVSVCSRGSWLVLRFSSWVHFATVCDLVASRLLCNTSLSFLSFPKSLLKGFFPPLALGWKGLSGPLCVCSICVNCWTWVDFWFDFSFAALIPWCFFFGFRYCSLCFLVFIFVLWCWSIFPESLSSCIHQRRRSTSEGISWNAGLGLAFGFGWEKGGWAYQVTLQLCQLQ